MYMHGYAEAVERDQYSCSGHFEGHSNVTPVCAPLRLGTEGLHLPTCWPRSSHMTDKERGTCHMKLGDPSRGGETGLIGEPKLSK